MAKLDTDLLNAALIGYQQELGRIKEQIAVLQRRLGGRSEPAPSPSRAARKHHVSAEGRARIAAAQRKRWAATKKKVMTAKG
jgi:hypothetical protein